VILIFRILIEPPSNSGGGWSVYIDYAKVPIFLDIVDNFPNFSLILCKLDNYDLVKSQLSDDLYPIPGIHVFFISITSISIQRLSFVIS